MDFCICIYTHTYIYTNTHVYTMYMICSVAVWMILPQGVGRGSGLGFCRCHPVTPAEWPEVLGGWISSHGLQKYRLRIAVHHGYMKHSDYESMR